MVLDAPVDLIPSPSSPLKLIVPEFVILVDRPDEVIPCSKKPDRVIVPLFSTQSLLAVELNVLEELLEVLVILGLQVA